MQRFTPPYHIRHGIGQHAIIEKAFLTREIITKLKNYANQNDFDFIIEATDDAYSSTRLVFILRGANSLRQIISAVNDSRKNLEQLFAELTAFLVDLGVNPVMIEQPENVAVFVLTNSMSNW